MIKYLEFPILLAILIALNSCSKDSVKPIKTAPNTSIKQINATGTISFSPAKGINYSAVTINDSGFSTTPANDVVMFNGIKGVVNFATTTQLIVTVPEKATTGKISVIINGVTTTSATNFRVLTFAQHAIITQQTNKITSLAFDNSANIYGVQQFTDHAAVIKYVNGVPVVLYSAPLDTAGSEPGGTGTVYQLSGLVCDSQGNIYASRVQVDENPDIDGPLYTFKTSIIKITPQKVVHFFAIDVVTETIGGDFNIPPHVEDMAIDAANNIYVVDNANSLIKEIAPSGTITSIANSSQFTNMVIDGFGNIYGDNGTIISKIQANGVTSTLSGPYIGSTLSSIVTYANNLLVQNGNSMTIINIAGNVNSYVPGFTLGTLFCDAAGNIYNLTPTTITKYSFE